MDVTSWYMVWTPCRRLCFVYLGQKEGGRKRLFPKGLFVTQQLNLPPPWDLDPVDLQGVLVQMVSPGASVFWGGVDLWGKVVSALGGVIRSCPTCDHLLAELWRLPWDVGLVLPTLCCPCWGTWALGNAKWCTQHSLCTGTSQSKAFVSKSLVFTQTWAAAAALFCWCKQDGLVAKWMVSCLHCGLEQHLCSLNSLFAHFVFSLPSTSKKSFRLQSSCLALCMQGTFTEHLYPGKSRNPTDCIYLVTATSRLQHLWDLGTASSTSSYCSLSPPERSLGLCRS